MVLFSGGCLLPIADGSSPKAIAAGGLCACCAHEAARALGELVNQAPREIAPAAARVGLVLLSELCAPGQCDKIDD
jgi:hypothetical protein